MSISPEYGLVVFVDATPSEQLSKQQDEVLCLTGVFVDDPSGLPGLRQCKDRRGDRRLSMASDLSRAISSGRPGILASGAFAQMGRNCQVLWISVPRQLQCCSAADHTQRTRGVSSSDGDPYRFIPAYKYLGVNPPRRQPLRP